MRTQHHKACPLSAATNRDFMIISLILGKLKWKVHSPQRSLAGAETGTWVHVSTFCMLKPLTSIQHSVSVSFIIKMPSAHRVRGGYRRSHMVSPPPSFWAVDGAVCKDRSDDQVLSRRWLFVPGRVLWCRDIDTDTGPLALARMGACHI